MEWGMSYGFSPFVTFVHFSVITLYAAYHQRLSNLLFGPNNSFTQYAQARTKQRYIAMYMCVAFE